MKRKVELGDKVKDLVTGFEGIAVAQFIYLQGCDRFQVQPPSDGSTYPESISFDDSQLKVVKAGVIKPGKKDVGGPCKGIPSAKVGGVR